MSNDERERRLSDQLKQLGFQPGEPVRTCEPGFTLDELKNRFLTSTFNHPRPITVWDGKTVGGLQVVVESIRQVFVQREKDGEGLLTFHEVANLWLEGWLIEHSASREAAPRVCMYIRMGSAVADSAFDETLVQRVPRIADPDGLIVLIEY